METKSYWSGTHFWECLKCAMSLYRREGNNLRAALFRLSVRGHASQGDPLGGSCYTARIPLGHIQMWVQPGSCGSESEEEVFHTPLASSVKIRKVSLCQSVTFYRLNKAVYVSLFPGCQCHFSKRLSEGLGWEWVFFYWFWIVHFLICDYSSHSVTLNRGRNRHVRINNVFEVS